MCNFQRFGIPEPDHLPFERNPILNDRIAYLLSHGLLDVQPDIILVDGPNVTFRSGTQKRFDMIIFATGFHDRFSFIADDDLTMCGANTNVIANTFHRDYDNLYVAGLVQSDLGGFWVTDIQCSLIASAIADRRYNAPRFSALRTMLSREEPDFHGGFVLPSPEHHSRFVRNALYYRYLLDFHVRMGWKFPLADCVPPPIDHFHS